MKRRERVRIKRRWRKARRETRRAVRYEGEAGSEESSWEDAERSVGKGADTLLGGGIGKKRRKRINLCTHTLAMGRKRRVAKDELTSR